MKSRGGVNRELLTGNRRQSTPHFAIGSRFTMARLCKASLPSSCSVYDQLPQLPPGEVWLMPDNTCFKVIIQSSTQPLFCCAAASS